MRALALGVPMAVPSSTMRPERAATLRRMGLAEPGEVEELLEVVGAFCGAEAVLSLAEDAGEEPEVAAVLARGRLPGTLWTPVPPGFEGRWILDALGRERGLLRVLAPLDGAAREGVDRAARLLGALFERSQARRELRRLPRGPAGASFVPGLVHELRNAAFGFAGILDAFEARYGDREEAQRYAGALRLNLERFSGFIDELGVYGDPSAGPIAPVVLEGLLGEAAAACQPQADRLGLRLQVRWHGPPAQVKADAGSLREAFTSLLRWALGQGGAGSGVRLLAHGAGGEAAGVLEGPGLQAEGLDLARIFEPFYFRASGMGRLALPMARRILEAHGGTLVAEPGPAGEIRFAFTLPCL